MEKNTSLLEWGPISLVRRNHGLEHATLNLLSELYPHESFAGHSDTQGFWVIGNISTDVLFSVVNQALERMRNGEQNLAIHPNCGTNLVTSGVVVGTFVWLGTLVPAKTFRRKLDRWPTLVLLATSALSLSRPLGPIVQKKITTSGNPGDLSVVQITRYERQGPLMHRVRTAISASAPEPVQEAEA